VRATDRPMYGLIDVMNINIVLLFMTSMDSANDDDAEVLHSHLMTMAPYHKSDNSSLNLKLN